MIMAFVIFVIIKFVNKAEEAAMKLANKNKPEEIPAPTTKICPFCKSEIAIEATRCPHCTSMLDEKEKDVQ